MVNLQQNVPLSNLSNFKIGGTADYFVQVKNLEEAVDAIKAWEELSKDFDGAHKKIFVLYLIVFYFRMTLTLIPLLRENMQK